MSFVIQFRPKVIFMVKKQPICNDNLIAHINLDRYFGEFVRPVHMDPYNL